MLLNLILYIYFLNYNLSYYYSPYDLKYYEVVFFCVGDMWLVSDTGASSAACVICFVVHYSQQTGVTQIFGSATFRRYNPQIQTYRIWWEKSWSFVEDGSTHLARQRKFFWELNLFLNNRFLNLRVSHKFQWANSVTSVVLLIT